MSDAARVSDPHSCPVAWPAPHLGGLVGEPGERSVKIGHMPAATEGTSCVCPSGPPNAILKGSTTVKIGHKGAARVGDDTSHGGKITKGCTTVLIGG